MENALDNVIKHFDSLGGLSNYKNGSSDFFSIEKYINATLDPLLKLIWKKYECMMFNKTVVLENIDVPMADEGVIDFNGFLTSGKNIVEIMDNNDDLFHKILIPFAEAAFGDYYSIHRDTGNVYYISHDYNLTEKPSYLIFNNIYEFLMSLRLKNENKESISTSRLVGFRLDPDLLKK